MSKVMAALPNIGGALCSTRKVWLTPNTGVPCSNAAKTRNPLKFAGVPQTNETILLASIYQVVLKLVMLSLFQSSKTFAPKLSNVTTFVASP